MRLEAPALRARERVVQVVGDQLDHLLAHQLAARDRTSSSAPQIVFERLAQMAASAVKQHALIGLADRERLAHLVPAEPVDVAQHHDLALARGERVERPLDLIADSPCASSRSSLSSTQCWGGDIHAPDASNRARSTTGPASPTARVRCSRTPVLVARLTRIRNSHVRNDERPAKPSIPRSTPTHVSCTTSSATAWLET